MTAPLTEDEDRNIDFWNGLLDLTGVESKNKPINTILVSYLTTCSEGRNKKFLSSKADLDKSALLLVESDRFKENKGFCISKMLSLLAIDFVDTSLKNYISFILLCEISLNPSSLDTLCEYQGFTVLYNNIYSHFAYLSKYGENSSKTSVEDSDLNEIEYEIMDEFRKVSILEMDLLFEIFKYCKNTITELQLIDDFFVYFLMSTIISDTTEDTFNNTKFKLLLGINEQYIMFGYKYEIENKVFKFLMNTSVSQSFVELLLLKFNRITHDRTLQIMICKIIHLVLTSTPEIAKDFFYLNDLKVLVDVLIRELNNISEDEEAIRNTFLRVLYPLLKFTEIANEQYRKCDLINLLTYLSKSTTLASSSSPCDSTKELSELTAHLAQKCLTDIPWLKEENSDEATSISSDFSVASTFIKNKPHIYRNPEYSVSADSIRTRKRPPPPIPRKNKT
ncbi:Ldb17p SCDLUD_000258 [Saccharomycodes ludwigii]|uniref:Ldb17p n=1 Tax=Saccharomycodes ludwigii TaxID=36035 RepID=UPI001E8756EA|nr:hypothetical protein SCDLUD_000258 [Saccharomycodes ludwigii]KAH3902675.1 hypothetical protein SCDLUD_000258 [Saccharomycodes ludwigii]